MKYNLQAIILEQCYYSMSAVKLLEENNIPFKRIDIPNDYKTKMKYINSEIQTFPQIYIINKNNKKLLGGYDDIQEMFDLINGKNELKNIKYNLKKKYPNFTDKEILRVIEIFLTKL